MSYNINWDAIFPDDDPLNHSLRTYNRSAEFVRVVKAIRPDILCLQEINPARDPQQVAAILDAALPLEGGEKWRAHRGQDNFIVSRFDLTMQADSSIHQDPALTRGHVLALADLPDGTYRADVYLICAHFKSSGGNIDIALREHHADALINWVRDIKTPGGKIDLPLATPLILLGDFNVYDTDPARHLKTLVTGDIVNENKYGPDLKPDWDDTDLADVLPRHNGRGQETYTWRNDTEPFNPGALDRIIYTDSVLRVDNAFVLNTTTLTEIELAATGLQANDIMLDPTAGNYDHLPLVVDITLLP